MLRFFYSLDYKLNFRICSTIKDSFTLPYLTRVLNIHTAELWIFRKKWLQRIPIFSLPMKKVAIFFLIARTNVNNTIYSRLWLVKSTQVSSWKFATTFKDLMRYWKITFAVIKLTSNLNRPFLLVEINIHLVLYTKCLLWKSILVVYIILYQIHQLVRIYIMFLHQLYA